MLFGLCCRSRYSSFDVYFHAKIFNIRQVKNVKQPLLAMQKLSYRSFLY